MAEIWVWFINDLAVISSVTWKTWMELGQVLKISLLKVKDVKKSEAIFFCFVLFHIGSTQVGRKPRYFMPVEGPGFKKIFIFK